MSQSAVLDCSFLDPFPFSRNDFVAQEVGVGGCDVAQVLVVTWLVAHDMPSTSNALELIAGSLRESWVSDPLAPPLNSSKSW